MLSDFVGHFLIKMSRSLIFLVVYALGTIFT